jgi:hypothetical protein
MGYPRSALLRLLRIALLAVLFLLLLSLVVAVGRPETGPFEKVVLVAAGIGLLGLAMPVHRIGQR